MLDIQKAAIAKLVAALNGVQAQYKIILPDGTEYGELEVEPVKKKGHGYLYKRGETAVHYKPFLENIPVGGVAVIPYDRFDPATLAANCYSYAWTLWGKGNSMGSRNDKTGMVEVMRLG